MSAPSSPKRSVDQEGLLANSKSGERMRQAAAEDAERPAKARERGKTMRPATV